MYVWACGCGHLLTVCTCSRCSSKQLLAFEIVLGMYLDVSVSLWLRMSVDCSYLQLPLVTCHFGLGLGGVVHCWSSISLCSIAATFCIASWCLFCRVVFVPFAGRGVGWSGTPGWASVMIRLIVLRFLLISLSNHGAHLIVSVYLIWHLISFRLHLVLDLRSIHIYDRSQGRRTLLTRSSSMYLRVGSG